MPKSIAPKTRKFGGKIYEKWSSHRSKRQADKVARDNRKIGGTPARVVKIEKQYIVYLKK